MLRETNIWNEFLKYADENSSKQFLHCRSEEYFIFSKATGVFNNPHSTFKRASRVLHIYSTTT